MKILIVLAHPEPTSFNGAMFQTATETLQQAGHEVRTSDLYRMNFNPVSDRNNFTSIRNSSFLKLQLEEIYATEVNGFVPELSAEQEKIEWCDLMIWQFPFWWFAPPAILKGWVDRVFAMGRIYGNGREPYLDGLFEGKKALLSITTGSAEERYMDDGIHGNIYGILKPVHKGILAYNGFSILQPQLSYSVAHLTDGERKAELQRWSERLKNIFDEETIPV